jgi:hypothetical protein
MKPALIPIRTGDVKTIQVIPGLYVVAEPEVFRVSWFETKDDEPRKPCPLLRRAFAGQTSK